MGLKDLKSRFDRHKIQQAVVSPAIITGPTIERPSGNGPDPKNGDYFREGNMAGSDSPFDTTRGDKMDQMVKLLEEDVKSNNHSYSTIGIMTYKPSPLIPGEFADLNGGYAPANSELGQFGGPYEGNFPG